jgi:hypothetical protein
MDESDGNLAEQKAKLLQQLEELKTAQMYDKIEAELREKFSKIRVDVYKEAYEEGKFIGCLEAVSSPFLMCHLKLTLCAVT